jgi:hypothetical protein
VFVCRKKHQIAIADKIIDKIKATNESTLLFLRGRKYPANKNIIGNMKICLASAIENSIKNKPKAYEKIDRSDNTLSASFSFRILVYREVNRMVSFIVYPYSF